jgi:hypothetical protein
MKTFICRCRTWTPGRASPGTRAAESLRKHGYFPGRDISAQKPLLMLVAPALHMHPTTDTILRYLSPGIEWEVLGIDERWREEIRVVFRKRPVRTPVRAA